MNEKITKVKEFLKVKKLDGIFISTPANIRYLTGFDFLVENEREAFLFITKTKNHIITSELYKADVQKYVPDFEFLNFTTNGTSFWEFIDDALAKRKAFDKTMKDEHIATLGFESKNITVAEYMRMKKLSIKLVALEIDGMRAIKTSEELACLRKACKITDKAFSFILPHIQEGITEKQLAFILDTHIRGQGLEPSFTTVIAFGEGSAVAHHTKTDKKLTKNTNILFDFGVNYHNYSSDMSRTVFFGKPSAIFTKVYKTVRESQQTAIDYVMQHTPPLSAKYADTVARDIIKKAGFPEFPHSLGHSVGINIHDGFALSPSSPTQLIEGMAFTIEPGIYIPGAFGVRIEDVIALTENGPEVLTQSSRDMIIL